MQSGSAAHSTDKDEPSLQFAAYIGFIQSDEILFGKSQNSIFPPDLTDFNPLRCGDPLVVQCVCPEEFPTCSWRRGFTFNSGLWKSLEECPEAV